MSRVAEILLRFAVIVLGYGVAALAASAFLHLLLFGPLGWPEPGMDPFMAGPLLVSIPLVALFAAYFAFIPAMIAIAIAELTGRRGWLYHAAAGAVSGIAALWLARAGGGPPPPDAYGELPLIWNPDLLSVAVAVGLVAGLAYWLVAGRGAGNWRLAASATSGRN